MTHEIRDSRNSRLKKFVILSFFVIRIARPFAIEIMALSSPFPPFPSHKNDHTISELRDRNHFSTISNSCSIFLNPPDSPSIAP